MDVLDPGWLNENLAMIGGQNRIMVTCCLDFEEWVEGNSSQDKQCGQGPMFAPCLLLCVDLVAINNTIKIGVYLPVHRPCTAQRMR
jgi:hypothetical protein